MERLNKTAPAVKLSAAQKKELAELDSVYAAKIAGREITLKNELAQVAGNYEKMEALREQLSTERKQIQAELDEKKERVRSSK